MIFYTFPTLYQDMFVAVASFSNLTASKVVLDLIYPEILTFHGAESNTEI